MGVLGSLTAHVCTIEFQKRGLPHCHFLCILDGEQHTCQDIDKGVNAEFPDQLAPILRSSTSASKNIWFTDRAEIVILTPNTW